ncbi:SP_1767 family glycosyltransferase [Carnobacterium mobile]|uniref:SP_1767 family glycosyltransferase n=1 Tax=Carnobacterium mobile TaxID=2750 RepID=UPI00068B07F5|nr:SP_1767 family glycosyltransferase [Carnobacterium mobile]
MFENLKNFIFKNIYKITKHSSKNPKIYSIEETIDKIITDKVAVSRYGDGEFKWMANRNQQSFQKNSPQLKNRLIEIIKTDEKNHIVCLTDVFGDLNQYTEEAKLWWEIFMGKFRYKWISFLKPGKDYYNTNITRPYMDYKDKENIGERFELLKGIWNERNLLIIEGEKTRLGINNDLFDNASSIKRILCPSTNAFDKYDVIINSIKSSTTKNDLILIALGPTATILAYDLSLVGLQAIDIGHIDIEYEWYLMKSLQKVPIKGKYVNEASNLQDTAIEENDDPKYLNSIILQIK